MRREMNEYAKREEKRIEDKKLRDEAELNRQSLQKEKELRAKRRDDEKREQLKALEEQRTLRRQEQIIERQEHEREARAQRAMRHGATIGTIIGASSGGGMVSAAVGGIGGMLGELKFGAAGGIIGALVGEIAEYVVNPMKAAFQASKSIIDFQMSTSSLGRAGGFAGGDLYRGLFPGSHAVPDWMDRLGITPQAAMSSLGALGVVPGSAGQAGGLAAMLAAQNRSPAFTGLADGSVEALLGQGAGLGMTDMSAGSSATYLQPFGKIMEESSARGMDRSRVLEAIQGGIENSCTIWRGRDFLSGYDCALCAHVGNRNAGRALGSVGCKRRWGSFRHALERLRKPPRDHNAHGNGAEIRLLENSCRRAQNRRRARMGGAWTEE